MLRRKLNIRTALICKRESGFPREIKALRRGAHSLVQSVRPRLSTSPALSTAIFVRYPLFTSTGMPAIFSLTDPSVDRVVK
jgi:hypothetical protein